MKSLSELMLRKMSKLSKLVLFFKKGSSRSKSKFRIVEILVETLVETMEQ